MFSSAPTFPMSIFKNVAYGRDSRVSSQRKPRNRGVRARRSLWEEVKDRLTARPWALQRA
jgi:ABC-type phosphate transport system ATPase subunit